ncbi:TPA: hypothetical protein DCZ36_02765 [Candidatus Gracilibacteria bacterium]|nr:hypothetical protein [Candidatus Gracilibacteria bacterium]
MLSQKVRNNASISYFFLGWLFLLAKNNPNFADPFIKQHAKIATKGHAIFFVTYFFYTHFLSSFFSYSIPVIQITIDHGIQIAFFVILTLFIIRGVYAGQKGEYTENAKDGIGLFSMQGCTFQFPGASEAQRILLLLSYIPFVGMIATKRFPNIVTTTGARASSIFGFFYLVSFTNGGFDSLSMILLFLGILIIVFLAARFFTTDSYTIPRFFERIPGMDSIYEIIRSVPPYLMDIGRMIFGKRDSVSFAYHIKNMQEKDRNLQISLQEYFTDETLPFQAFWIFIPFCNLVFLPKLFTSRATRYVLAIGQGLVITLLFIIIGLLFSFTSPFELFLLFPMFYGIASLESNVFIRIPLVYEIYAILNTLTFGLLKNTKRIQVAQKQDTMVRFTVE